MSKRTLLVWPNPFSALDHEGCPAGVLPFEPQGNGVTTFDDRRFVGATLKAEILEKFPKGDARHAVQRTTFEYGDEPTRVPATPYYKHAIATGQLFAADKESAALCGILKVFYEPGELLERAKKEAAEHWILIGHEEHDPTPPEVLTKFTFGPMKKAPDTPASAPAPAPAPSPPPPAAEDPYKARKSTAPRGGE